MVVGELGFFEDLSRAEHKETLPLRLKLLMALDIAPDLRTRSPNEELGPSGILIRRLTGTLHQTRFFGPSRSQSQRALRLRCSQMESWQFISTRSISMAPATQRGTHRRRKKLPLIELPQLGKLRLFRN
jgi:hypothetical protein